MFKKMKIKRLEKKLAKLREEEKLCYKLLEGELDDKACYSLIRFYTMEYVKNAMEENGH